jgi:hypothetical protein
MRDASFGMAPSSRSTSSPAALFENVRIRIDAGSTPSASREQTRFTRLLVFPVPGPAWSWKAEPRWAAARRCESSGRRTGFSPTGFVSGLLGGGNSNMSKSCWRTRLIGSPMRPAIAFAVIPSSTWSRRANDFGSRNSRAKTFAWSSRRSRAP